MRSLRHVESTYSALLIWCALVLSLLARLGEL